MPSRYDTDTAYLYYTEGGAYRVSGPEFARCINKLNHDGYQYIHHWGLFGLTQSYFGLFPPLCLSTMATRQGLNSLLKTPRSISSLQQSNSTICRQCQRSFVTTPVHSAGHNKWSKTKHIKAVTDKKKMSERAAFTKTIAMYSRSRQSLGIAWSDSISNLR